MPIHCHVEHDEQGTVLSGISSMADAEIIRRFFAERGIAAMVAQHRMDDYRVYVPGMPNGLFSKLIAGSNIELI